MGTLRIVLGLSLCFLFTSAYAINWPVYPDSNLHEVGNSYCQLQYYPEYGGDPFLHTGVDIMAEPGTPVYAVKSGYVKAIMTPSNESYWRIAIADSASNAECDAYMYAHMDESSIFSDAGLQVGDYIEVGQYIGDVVFFPYPDSANAFHHLHFSKIRAGGSISWGSYYSWIYSGNPLDDIDDIGDADAPVFEDVLGGQMLVFAYNGIPLYYEPGATLSGDIDIICHVSDRINSPDWDISPYKVEYRLLGPTPMDWKTTYCFTTPLGPYGSQQMNAWYTIFADDDSALSVAGYNEREFYIHVTHTDGDSIIEYSDDNQCWHTADFKNGEYTVEVRASDCAGNSTTISTTVTLENTITFAGNIHPSDAPADTSGFIVTMNIANLADTTDADGTFDFGTISAGPDIISVRKDGYWPLDTVLTLNSNRILNITMDPIDFICGDANGDDLLDADDIVSLENYLFSGQTAPIPLESGDADNCGGINIGDIAFLADYLYRGGSTPCESYHDCDDADAEAEISIGCPIEVLTAESNVFSVPVYYSCDTAAATLSIALTHNSDDIQIDSVVFASVMTSNFINSGATILNDSNKVILYGYAAGTLLPAQSQAEMATIWLSVLPGASDQMINIETTSALSGITTTAAVSDGSPFPVSYSDCGDADITIIAYTMGDANGDGTINIGDAVYLITYIFKGGPAPEPLAAGDADCNGSCNIGDAVFLINYIFKGGPEPGCH
ncbi:MAG: dockerin type I domain-containing protein [Candidatus Zixiibacteriota bacterium]